MRAAQITCANPPFVAIAAALNVNRVPAGSQRSEQQTKAAPDGVGNESESDGAPVAILEKETSSEVDLRTIKVERFDGMVPPGRFDAKGRKSCEELDEEIDDAQAVAGQVWDDEIKKALFKILLTRIARRWYSDWRAANTAASYADGASAMIHEF